MIKMTEKEPTKMVREVSLTNNTIRELYTKIQYGRDSLLECLEKGMVTQPLLAINHI